MKRIFLIVVVLIALAGVMMLLSVFREEGDIVSCTADALLCPDGSAVGRVGPNCEFAACPYSDGITFTLRVGETIHQERFDFTVLEVLEDSRCAPGVQCMWEGIVRIRVRFVSNLGALEQTMTLRETISREDDEITLINVEPYPMSGRDNVSDAYRFTFFVKRI